MSSSCAVSSTLAGIRVPTAARRSTSSTSSSSRSPLNSNNARRRSSHRVSAATDVAEKLSSEELASWESCRMMVMDLGLDEEAAEKCLVKAFGW
jgi:hypothetical protein